MSCFTGMLCTNNISMWHQKVHPWENNVLLSKKSQEKTPGIHQMHYLFHLNSPWHLDFHQPSILSDTLYYFCSIVWFLSSLEGALILRTSKALNWLTRILMFKEKRYILNNPIKLLRETSEFWPEELQDSGDSHFHNFHGPTLPFLLPLNYLNSGIYLFCSFPFSFFFFFWKSYVFKCHDFPLSYGFIFI